MFRATGKLLLGFFKQLGQASLMIERCAFWVVRAPVEWTQSSQQIARIGADSLLVALLTSLFVGMVLALQAGATVRNIIGEPLYIGILVGFSLVRELGPVLTAFVIAGRAGAAVAAEIGTMRVTEQTDALHTLGTDPIRYLIIPRMIGFIVGIPVLTLLANVSGIFGGYLVSVYGLGVSPDVYIDDITTFLKVGDLAHGFIKSVLFSFMLGTVCCHKGLSTRGGAQGVGKATTSAVVTSMVLILIMDYFITAILNAAGI